MFVHSNISSVIWPLLLLIAFVSIAQAEDCRLDSIWENTNCTINRKHSGGTDIALIHLAGLRLFSKDSLTVQIGDNSLPIELFSDGILVLPNQNEYVFSVTTSADPGVRKIDKIEVLNDKTKLSVTELNQFSILVLSGTNLKTPISLSNKENSAIWLSSETKGVIANSQNGADSPTKDQSLDDEDFLTSSNKINLKLSIKDIKTDSRFNFNLMKVAKSCSKLMDVDDKPVEAKTIDTNIELSKNSYQCVYFVKSKTGGNLQIDKFDIKTTSSSDKIIIKDGLKSTSNDLINIPAKDASNYAKRLDKTISSGSGLLVIFSFSFIDKKYEPSVITIKKSAVTKYDKEGPFEIKTAENAESIYIFSLADKYPVLTFSSSFNLTKTDLKVYDNLDLSSDQVLTFNQNDVVNNELWAEKRMIILKFNSSSSLSVKGELKSRTVNCNLMGERPSTFILNGNKELVDQNCNIYFKPQDTSHSVILNLESISLSPDACLSLKAVTNQKNIFKLCPNNVKDALEKFHLRELILTSNDSYVLSYDEKKNFKEEILVQATFVYNARKPMRKFVLTKEQPTTVIQSFNYPSNYPFIINATDVDLVNTENASLFVSFDNQNIRKGDELKFLSNSSNPSKTIDKFDDFIVMGKPDSTNFIAISLQTSQFEVSGNDLIDDSYTSGFNISIERFDCVLKMDPKTNIIQTPDYPKLINASKCIGVIDLSKESTKKGKYLQLNVTNGRTNDGSFGNLTIFDDSSILRPIRDNIHTLIHYFNSTVLQNNETLTFNTSSTKIIVLFEQSSDVIKFINGFQIEIGIKDCNSNLCDGNTRCLLEEIHCNYVAECRDEMDESISSGCSKRDDHPPPQPDPEKIIEYRGLSIWIILLIIIPLSVLVGFVLHMNGPMLLGRFRLLTRGSHRYSDFNTFENDSI